MPISFTPRAVEFFRLSGPWIRATPSSSIWSSAVSRSLH